MTRATRIRAQQRPITKEEIERMKKEKEQGRDVEKKKDADRARPADPKPSGPGRTG